MPRRPRWDADDHHEWDLQTLTTPLVKPFQLILAIEHNDAPLPACGQPSRCVVVDAHPSATLSADHPQARTGQRCYSFGRLLLSWTIVAGGLTCS